MDPQRWLEIERLYHLAREREAGERGKFLAEACGGDEPLRREVESLLARPPEGRDFLEAPALEVAARALGRDQGDAPPTDLAGRTIAHYRVLEKIGEGGMGVVYRGHDSRLTRDIAIKVLPDVFAGDPQRLARFEREARLLASLNHPNIAAIHGLEEYEGKLFLILELVEGQTLSERLMKSRIPLDETLDICRQIAEGLEAAHEKGIIHRDLKPANVKVTPEGKVKILDFGLAKAFYEQGAPVDPSRSPTITEQMTAPDVILGTAAYMSPEQAKGKPVDKRADIWAFGCVMYECLTGKRAFQGDTITETLAAILKSEPEWTPLPAETPPAVRAVLRECFQKDPAHRLRDVADAFIGIQALAAQPPEWTEFPRRSSVWWIAGSVVVVAVAAAFVTIALMKRFQVAPSARVTRAIVRIEPGQWLAGTTRQMEFWRPCRTSMAISSDGRFIVYSAIEGNPSSEAVPRLYLRQTDKLEAKPIEGTEGGINPFLSPDDRWVGFWANDKLRKVTIEGGVPVILCDAAWTFGVNWGPDNNIVFSPDQAAGLFSVADGGGKPQPLTTPDRTKEEVSHRLPHYLPDSKGVLFTITKDVVDTQPSVALLDLKSRKWRVLLEDAADARYIPTGHLVFLRRGTLIAVPFNLNRLEITGQPVPAIANVMQATNSTNTGYNTDAGQFSISNSGWLIYVTGGVIPDMENSLLWVDQRGNAQPVASLKASFGAPRLSPDGQRIAFSTSGSEWRLHVYDLTRGTESSLAGEGKSEFSTWTPDGKRLVFDSWKSGVSNLCWQPADTSAPMERLTTSQSGMYPGSLTPDGATLAFGEYHPDTGHHIMLLDLLSRRVTPLLNSEARPMYPMFSPDGRWLAYTSEESGRREVYVRPFPNLGGKWKVSLEGGSEPLWTRNGKQLFYRWRDQVWVVDVRTDAGFTPGKPHLLFERPGFRTMDLNPCWDISVDGQKFLMVKLDDRKPQPVTEMILVMNWFEELKRLCPAK